MRKAIPVVALLALVVLISGCGGGGGGGSASTASPFAGQWIGAWSDAINSQSGTLGIVIATDGSVTGSIYNATFNMVGTTSGSITSSGVMTATYVFPGVTNTGQGTMTINGSGNLVGVIQTFAQGDLAGSSNIQLTKQ